MGILAQRCGVMYRREKSISAQTHAIDASRNGYAGFFDDQTDKCVRFFGAEKYLPTSTLADEALV